MQLISGTICWVLSSVSARQARREHATRATVDIAAEMCGDIDAGHDGGQGVSEERDDHLCNHPLAHALLLWAL